MPLTSFDGTLDNPDVRPPPAPGMRALSVWADDEPEDCASVDARDEKHAAEVWAAELGGDQEIQYNDDEHTIYVKDEKGVVTRWGVRTRVKFDYEATIIAEPVAGKKE